MKNEAMLTHYEVFALQTEGVTKSHLISISPFALRAPPPTRRRLRRLKINKNHTKKEALFHV
ncbi:MAG: hypothetical protein IJO16_01410 [Clostridia bacterium]|nr:hypothetical protein [Clostridia bacterium]